MKDIKDHFSGHARQYARYRPVYPDALYQYLYELVPAWNTAWDCATGNGQVAVRLAERFALVNATDISAQQMQQAPALPNVHYTTCRAEASPFEDQTFDLITVGQALHWFDFEGFFREVQRVGKDGSVLAVWGYQHVRVNEQVDPLIVHFYDQTIGPYWDDERQYVKQAYLNIAFPFEELSVPDLSISTQWDIKQFAGYLETWSSVRKYIRQHGQSPVPEFIQTLQDTGALSETFTVHFPVFLRVFTIRK